MSARVGHLRSARWVESRLHITQKTPTDESQAGHSRTNRGPEALHRSFLVVYHSWWGRDSYVIIASFLARPLIKCVWVALAFPFCIHSACILSQRGPCSFCNTRNFLSYGGVCRRRS